MQEYLILVDQFGRRTGVAKRAMCHQGVGMRHRAFVTFLCANDGKFLVQKRIASKLGGDRWDVSATSHVRADESYSAAINRCLRHELGIIDPVRPRYQLAYLYQNQLGSHAENEYCSLFLVNYDGSINPNSDEMEAVQWLTVDELKEWFDRDEGQFTQWFSEAFRRMIIQH